MFHTRRLGAKPDIFSLSPRIDSRFPRRYPSQGGSQRRPDPYPYPFSPKRTLIGQCTPFEAFEIHLKSLGIRSGSRGISRGYSG